MRIAVIGTGYVGLVTGACFAHVGWDVTCVDYVADKIERLRNGIVPIYEPGLEELVAANKSRLHFTTNLADAIDGAEIIIIAVGTPTRKLDGNADLRYIFSAAEEIGRSLAPTPLLASLMASEALLAGADDDARSRLLPRIATGEVA